MDKKKILSSLALAGILTAGVIGANVNATTANEYLKPVGVYKKLIEGKTVVPYVLKDKDTPVTVKDIQSEFKNLEKVNGNAVADINLKMKTGDTFKANGIEHTLVIYGDANKDGKITTMDALAIQKVITGKGEIDSIQSEGADVNNNGKITTMDALAIQKYIVGKQENVIDKLPKIEDITGPVLNGIKDGDKKIININDTTFKLPEVTATDDYDGEVEVIKEGDFDISTVGEYKITYSATDREGNNTKATLTIIVNNVEPVIEGITDGQKFHVKLNDNTFNLPSVTATDAVDGNIRLEIEGNYNVNVEGEYTVKYSAKNSSGKEVTATVIVIVDGTNPNVTVDYDIKATTNQNVTATITADEKLLPLEGWTLAEDALSMTKVYEKNITEEVTVKDLAENETKLTITITNIDKDAPVVNGVEDGKFYKTVTPTFIEGVATLQKDEEPSQTYRSGTGINTDGKYVLKVIDAAGNSTTINFTIDNVAPVFEELNPETKKLDPITLKKGDILPTVIVKDEVNGDIEATLKIVYNRTTVEYIDTTGERDGIYTVTYTAIDEAGNSSTATRVVTVDATPAELKALQKSTAEATKEIIIRVEFNEKMQPLDGWTIETTQKAFTKKYTENADEVVKFKDLAGNETSVNIKFDNINALAAAVSYSTIKPTNKSVTATIRAVEELQEIEGWTLSDDKLSMTKEYTENTKEAEKVTISDLNGNEVTVSVEITNIDKVEPTAEVEFSKEGPTNEDVIVTIKSNKVLKAVRGWKLSKDKQSITKTYTDNTAEEVTIKDLAGNAKTVTISVTNIDKVAPTGKVIFSTTSPTNKNVIATITANEELKEVEGWTLSEDKKSITKEYTANTNVGEKVTITDLAGNTKVVTVNKISNIDKDAPTVTGFIEGITSYKTITPIFTDKNEPITATLQRGNEEPTDFVSGTAITEDGTYKLIVTDSVGNSKTIIFSIVNAVVKISNVEDGKVYKTVTPTFVEGAGVLSTLNDDDSVISTKIYTSGTPITEDGKYKLTVTDAAGNSNSVTFTIDNIGPKFTNIVENGIYKNITPVVVSKATITSIELKKDNEVVESYTTLKAIKEEGVYELTVSDEAGNRNSIKFTIDNSVKNVKVTYSENQDNKILVTITADEKIKVAPGWTLTTDGYSMTKEYIANKQENVRVSDINGNSVVVSINVTGIK